MQTILSCPARQEGRCVGCWMMSIQPVCLLYTTGRGIQGCMFQPIIELGRQPATATLTAVCKERLLQEDLARGLTTRSVSAECIAGRPLRRPSCIGGSHFQTGSTGQPVTWHSPTGKQGWVCGDCACAICIGTCLQSQTCFACLRKT